MTDKPLNEKAYLATIIEQRILAEQGKHKTLDWVMIASDKIASEIVYQQDEKVERLKKEVEISYRKYLVPENTNVPKVLIQGINHPISALRAEVLEKVDEIF